MSDDNTDDGSIGARLIREALRTKADRPDVVGHRLAARGRLAQPS